MWLKCFVQPFLFRPFSLTVSAMTAGDINHHTWICCICKNWSDSQVRAAQAEKWVVTIATRYAAPVCHACVTLEWREYRQDYRDSMSSGDWFDTDSVNKDFASGLLRTCEKLNTLNTGDLEFH